MSIYLKLLYKYINKLYILCYFIYMKKKFKKVVILDSVIFYPEHRRILSELAEEIVEYPSSLPENLEKQYEQSPELFQNIRCYTELPVHDHSLQLLMNRIEGADVVISCWTGIPDEVLKLNPQLKLIIFWTHEKEHRVNLTLAENMGIRVTNVPDYGTHAVTEVVFAGFWELIQRNDQIKDESQKNIVHQVMPYLFNYFRKLRANEKYTRAGKFTHHFHKLGLVEWDFGKKSLDQMIPERLIQFKRVGLLNIDSPELENVIRTFQIIPQTFQGTDQDSAEFYKFLAENEVIFYDSEILDSVCQKKAEELFPGKLVNIQELPAASYELQGKKFGIIGMGRIGQQVARIARELGFEVVYYSKSRQPELEKQRGLTYLDLPELMRISDVISLHVPAYKAEGLLTADLFGLMKSRAIFINTADGNAIDQKALMKRAEQNEIFVYLDVYPGLPRKDVLGLSMNELSDWKIHNLLPNHVFAYRAGWKTQESIRVKTYKLLGEMIDAF
ncbi:hypothetical protein EXS71_02680 [Candidatus Uhrbacteria bacterium]|nr:hypothetical protein [Candidatus Uhrbacteria bacterium]